MKTEMTTKPETQGERERLIKALRDMRDIDFDDVFFKAAALLAADGKAGGEVLTIVNEDTAYETWFMSQQGRAYGGMWEFAKAAWMFRAATRPQPAAQVACPSCHEAHAVLDADDSKIIRNAKDGYPDGREPRELTLAERVAALCTYAADWKRWCLNNEKAAQVAQPLTHDRLIEIGMQMYGESKSPGSDPTIREFNRIARAIEAAHGIGKDQA